MTNKNNIDPEKRGFYFASSGLEKHDGATLERPKLIVQSAIDQTQDIEFLDPPPSLFSPAQVSAAQGGSFSEGFVLPGFVNFDAANAIFNANQDVSITLGDGQICSIFGVRNGNDDSTCYLLDGTSLAGTRSLFCVVDGADSIGYEIKGATLGAFSTCDRLTVGGERSIGFKITGTFSEPIDIDGDVVLLNRDDAVYVDYNPTNPTDACTVDISTIFSDGANVFSRGICTTTAYIARSGHLTIKGSVLIAKVAVDVKSGAEVDMREETVVGDINVDLGGILNVDILDHEDGTITRNGIINGVINNVVYRGDPDTDFFREWTSNGLNSATIDFYLTERNPNSNITANPGSIAYREDGENSAIYLNEGDAPNDDIWCKVQTRRTYPLMAAWKDPDEGEFLQWGATDSDDSAACFPYDSKIVKASLCRSNTSSATVEILIEGVVEDTLDTSAETTTYDLDIDVLAGDKVQLMNQATGSSKIENAVIVLIMETKD